ncbi:MAG: site-specific DNA-methyltransferase, partial [Treponema sp.]|nr:site-specific DNA-methyltransferase [Treponema sp.]
PPYNTGNDFIYPDNYQEPVEDYLRFTGQMDDKGNMLVANPKSGGKFHRRWLNMMYPRLQLARELLTDDGVILINIDENEVSNLYLLCSEIFGEENDLGTIIWDKRNPKGDSQGIACQHETILLFAKSKYLFLQNCDMTRPKKNAQAILDKASQLFRKVSNNYTLEQCNSDFNDWLKTKVDFSGGEKAYNKIDEEGNVYRPVSMAWPNKKKAPDEYFIPLIHPVTKKPCPIPERGWRNPPKTMNELLEKSLILFGKDESTQPNRKYLLKENMNENIPSLLYYGGSDTDMLSKLGIPFDTPKVVDIVKEHILSFSNEDSIIMDFYSGSCTTAHAVMEINKEKETSKRKFIMVQLPVETEVEVGSNTKSFPNICEIGKERIRRAGTKILEEAKANKDMFSKDNPLDVGFKVYRLAKSNFTAFENISGTDKAALDTLFAAAEKEPLTKGWKERKSSVVAELCLRHGFVLDSKITKCPEYTKNEVLKIVDQNEEKTMFVCLDEKISEETAKTLHLEDGEKFICLDNAIGDQLKVQLADKGRIETI